MIKNKNKIVIATGGTGGHIFTSVSLSNSLSKNYQVEFITDKRGLNYFDKNKNFNVNVINSSPIFSKNIFKVILGLIKFFFTTTSSLSLLIKLKPKLIIGMGGYSSVGVCLAAFFLKIPIIIYENNLVIGRANRFLLPISKKILVSTKSIEGIKKKYQNKIFLSGFFIRKEVFEIKKINLNEQEKKLSILIIGGSQSAKVFGEYLPKIIKKCYENNIKFKIYQQCLDYQKDKLNKIYKELNLDFELFTFTNNLLKFYEKADFAITRSGASSLAELVNLKIPFITIPLPSSIDNHQLKNAMYFEHKGYCLIVEQKYIFEKLFETLKDLNQNRNKLINFKEKMAKHSDQEALPITKELIERLLNV